MRHDIKLLLLSMIIFLTFELRSSAEEKKLLRILTQANEVEENSDYSNNSQTNTGDVLIVPIYKSRLDEVSRAEYMNWVSFENSLNSYGGQLVKLQKYFAPENTTYITSLYKYGLPFYIAAGILGLVFLLFLILRFGFKLCLGPKRHITSAYGLFTWILIGINFY